MSKTKVVVWSSVVLVVLLVVSTIIWSIGIINKEVSLSNRCDALENKREVSLDTMRKILINKFKIKEDFANDYLKVVNAQASGRKGGFGVKLNVESANKLGMTPEVYLDMMNSISGQMSNFQRVQNELTDVWREHVTLCKQFPSRMLVGDKIRDMPEMISSSKAKEIVETKVQEDNLLP